MKTRLGVLALLALVLAVPMFGETHKNTYPVPCGDLWGAVKSTLSNRQYYDLKKNDDAKMTASYKVKHSIHISITEAFTQGTAKVALVPNDTGCEMQAASNYSGIEHDDQGDFKKRVDEFLAKQKAEQQLEPAADEPAK